MNAWKSPYERSRAGVPAEVLEVSALFAEVVELHGALSSAMDEMAGESGLTGARWQVLAVLGEGTATVAATARALGLARQSVQRTMDGLAGDGFVEYHDNPGHKRASLARLTEQGERALSGVGDRQAAWLRAVSRDLQPANLRMATGILRGLLGRTSGVR